MRSKIRKNNNFESQSATQSRIADVNECGCETPTVPSGLYAIWLMSRREGFWLLRIPPMSAVRFPQLEHVEGLTKHSLQTCQKACEYDSRGSPLTIRRDRWSQRWRLCSSYASLSPGHGQYGLSLWLWSYPAFRTNPNPRLRLTGMSEIENPSIFRCSNQQYPRLSMCDKLLPA